MPRKRKGQKGLLKGPSEVFTWEDFSGGLDEGSTPYKMDLKDFKIIKNMYTDERPGILTKRGGVLLEGEPTFTTENLFAFRRGDGTERLMRSENANAATTTRIRERNDDGTWSYPGYTDAGGTVNVTSTNTATQATGSGNYQHWVKVNDELATSGAPTTWRTITTVNAASLVAAGLTDGAGQTFVVRKQLGVRAFVDFVVYKDHLWWVSGTSNFLMAYDGTDVFENPNGWSGGSPERRTTETDCPKGSSIAIWNERMWIGGLSGTNGLSLLRYSPVSYERANNPDQIMWNTLNEEPIAINDGSIVRWLRAAHERLYIFKDHRETGIWFLQGNSPDDWVLKSVNRAQGTRFGRLVQTIPTGPFEGSLFYLGFDDFFAYRPDMQTPQSIGGIKLRETLKDISTAVWIPDELAWPTDASFTGGTHTNTTGTSGVTGTVTLDTDTDVDTAFGGTKTLTSSSIISGSVIIDHDASNFYRSHQSTANDQTMDDQVSGLSQAILTPSYRLLTPTIRINLKKTGSPTGNVVAHFYSVDGNGLPSVLLETSGTTVTASGLSDSAYATRDFVFTNTLSPDTLGAIVLSTSVATTSSNKIHWGEGGSSSTGFIQRSDFKNSQWNKRTGQMDLRIFQYLDTGTREYISAEIDTAVAIPAFGNLVATETLNGGTVTYFTRTKASSPVDTAYVEVANGAKITHGSPLQFIQWKAVFTNLAVGDTPKVDDVTIQWAATGATWESGEGNAGTAVNNWGSFNATQFTGDDGTVTWQIKFDDSSPIGSGSGNASAYANITPGQGISDLSTPPVVGDKFFEIKATFSTTDPTTSIPVVTAASVGWLEGEVPTRLPSSGVFENRIFVYFTRDGATAPVEPGLIYNRDGQWSVMEVNGLNAQGMSVFQNRLYIGSGDATFIAFIEKNSETFADAGGGFEIDVGSPQFDMGSRSLRKYFRKWVLTGETAAAGGDIIVWWALDQMIPTALYSTDLTTALGGSAAVPTGVTEIAVSQTETASHVTTTDRHEFEVHVSFPFTTVGKRIAFRFRQKGQVTKLAITKLAIHYELLPDTDTDDKQGSFAS